MKIIGLIAVVFAIAGVCKFMGSSSDATTVGTVIGAVSYALTVCD